MKLRTQIKNDRTIVHARFGWKEKLNPRDIAVLSNNTVLGLMSLKQRRKKLLEYTGVKSVSLKKYLEAPITKRDFLLIVAQVNAIFRKTKQLNLPPKNVYLDMNGIFVNPVTKELSFLYLPVAESAVGADYLSFLSGIINAAKPTPEQNAEYITQFAFFLRKLECYDPGKIDGYIGSLDRTVMEMVSQNVPDGGRRLTDKPGMDMDYNADTGILESIDWDYEEDTGLLSGGKEDGFRMEENETTNLAQNLPGFENNDGLRKPSGVGPRLTRKQTGEEIRIDKPVFRIGKERSYVDYFIADNGAISRSHADIILRNGRVFIRDLNSKNRTYVNGTAIEPEMEVELFPGNIVKLANEEFLFSMK